MKKAVILSVLLILLVASMAFALPRQQAGAAGTAGGSSARASDPNLVELNDGYRVDKDSIQSLIQVFPCGSTQTNECWKVNNRQLIYIDSSNNQISGTNLDSVQDFWEEKVSVDSYGNLYNPETRSSGTPEWVYFPNGGGELLPLEGSTVTGKITSLGNVLVMPLKTSSGEELFQLADITQQTTIVLGKSLYESLQSLSPPSITIDAVNNKISWKADGKDNFISQVTNNGATTTTMSINGATTTAWSFAGETLRSEDGWELQNADKFVNKNTKETVLIQLVNNDHDQRITRISESGEKTFTTIKGEGPTQIREILQQDKNGRTTSFQLRDAQNNLIGERIDVEGGELNGFAYYRNNRIIGVCYDSNCNSGDKTNAENIWLTEIDGKMSACKGASTACYDQSGNPVRGQFYLKTDVCPSRPQLCDALTRAESHYIWGEGLRNFLSGNTEAQQVIGQILNFRPGWQSLSLWFLPDETKALNKFAAETFDRVLLADYVVPHAICDYDNTVKQQGESSTFIEVAPGIIQFVGSVTAERTPQAGPALCSEELPCQRGECDDEGVCRDTNGNAVTAFFYKITWAVQAPADESFTPYRDENGMAVKFNIQIRGDRNLWLYPATGTGTDTTLQLENGAADRDTIVAYSTFNYNEVCILFGAAAKDLDGDEVSEICADIAPSTLAQTEWGDAGRPGSSGSSTGNVRVEDVGRVRI